MNELDYKFDYVEDTYIVSHEHGSASILNCEGDRIVTIFNYNVWLMGQPFPENMAKIMLSGYQAGYLDGKQRGYLDAQYDMRRVLGL